MDVEIGVAATARSAAMVGERTVRFVKHAKFRQEKFGGVLFDTRSEKVYALNPTAAAIAREIGAGCAESDLIERMAARFHDVNGNIEREVRAFTAQLRQQGLLEA